MTSRATTSFDERMGQTLGDAGLVTTDQLSSARDAGLRNGVGLLETLVLEGLVPRDTQLSVEVAQAVVDRLDASIRENQDSSVEASVEKQPVALCVSMVPSSASGVPRSISTTEAPKRMVSGL